MLKVSVSELLKDEAKHLGIKLVYGKRLLRERFINSHRIQKPGLGLAGYTEHLHSGRVQILGNTEISYLRTLTSQERKEAVNKLCELNLACFIVTKNLNIPIEIMDAVKVFEIPLLKSELESSDAIEGIQSFLEDRLAPETVEHGVMLDVFGIGVLILGRSGIGKSECAIELVKRGHRLVADDAVRFIRKQDVLIASSSEMLKHFMEVRGLGILNIKDMFGVTAIRQTKKLELVIKFMDWEEHTDYDRLGIEKNTYKLLGIDIPIQLLPITAGRNMAVIVEAAARNYLLKLMGYDSAESFSKNLEQKLKEQQNDADVIVDRIIGDKGVE